MKQCPPALGDLCDELCVVDSLGFGLDDGSDDDTTSI